jgi:hypothetical protein
MKNIALIVIACVSLVLLASLAQADGFESHHKAPVVTPAVDPCPPPVAPGVQKIPEPPACAPAACAPATSCSTEHPVREGARRLGARARKFGGRVVKAATAPVRWLFGKRE